MKRACQAYREHLSSLGRDSAAGDVLAHAEACPDCQTWGIWFERVARAGRMSTMDAPEDVATRAKQIMQPQPSKLARFISGELALVVRGGAAEDIPLLLDADGVQVRMLLTPEGRHWRLIGRIDDKDAIAVHRDKPLTPDSEGRFQFTARNLKDTGLSILLPGRTVDVPPVTELSLHDGG